MRTRKAKMILWFLTGLGFTVIVLRILHGPGSVTVLTDILPWGLWKGLGVVALVPIGGAGFTLAMLVYIFHLKKFKPLVRGAVLLGLMCYSCVAFGLSMDIGIWWRIVYPVTFWQIHSVLFEVAWCIMLYLMVLMAETGLMVFERLNWRRALGVLEKISLILVIFGICLSTLHQSSLGTLFLAAPFRLHPLWHTDALPVLFFISSMALGCLTISLVTLIVFWLYGGKIPMKAISGLGAVSAGLIIAYLVIKFGEIFISGEGGRLVFAGWDAANFWIEIALSCVLPLLLLKRSMRENPVSVFWISLGATIGMCLNRVNVAGLATLSLTHSFYFPAWTEWAMTAGILAAAALFYLFCVEQFALFHGVGKDSGGEARAPIGVDPSDAAALLFRGHPFASLHLNSLAFILAAAAGFALVPKDAVFGVTPDPTPVEKPRSVEISKLAGEQGSTARFWVEPRPDQPQVERASVLLLDSNRNGRYVLFDHEQHEKRYEGKKSCVLCHHMNKPLDQSSGCYKCHTDMYLQVDVFDHDRHVERLGGEDHCFDCHDCQYQAKMTDKTKACLECHKGMVAKGSRIKMKDKHLTSSTVGYMDAVHGLCINCHLEKQKSMAEPDENLSRCTHCHQTLPDLEAKVWESQR